MSLFSTIANRYRTNDLAGNTWRVLAKRATVLRIQQAADMFALSPKDEWSVVEDFPIVVPPWSVTWLEWRSPATFVEAGGSYRVPTRGDLGVLLECRRVSPGWRMFAACFGEVGMVGGIDLMLDANGKPRLDDHGPYANKIKFFVTAAWENDTALATHGLLMLWGFPMLLALSFCHCVNVEINEHVIDAALVKKHRKRSHDVTDRFYVLDIVSIRKVLRAAGSDQSLKLALHLCRGHFKDYRSGAGLFGRQHGLWWWDMQARGHAELGEVKKDYRVHPEA